MKVSPAGSLLRLILVLLYQSVATVLFTVCLPYVFARAVRHPREMRERLGWGPAPGRAPRLWVHAASLGELQGAAGFLTAINAPPEHVFLTVLSVSARGRAEGLFPNVRCQHAPLDLWFCWIPFALRQRPRALVLLETEIWPGWLAFSALGRLPTVVVSGRISDRNWRRLKAWRAFFHPFCQGLSGVGAQTALDAKRWRALGASPVTVTGNLKYRGRGEPPLSPRPGHWMFVAGSLRRGDEVVLDAARSLLEAGRRVVVVPRHLREIEYWSTVCAERGVPFLLRSRIAGTTAQIAQDGWQARHPSPENHALLVDVHGELEAWYAAASAAFVGGTLARIGGHSLFEPAVAGCPTAFGPSIENTRDVADALLECGGGALIRDADELTRWAQSLAEDPKRWEAQSEGALGAARGLLGAGARTTGFLQELCFPVRSA